MLMSWLLLLKLAAAGNSLSWRDRFQFVDNFIGRLEKSPRIVSFLETRTIDQFNFHKRLSRVYGAMPATTDLRKPILERYNNLFIALLNEDSKSLIKKAAKENLFKCPSKWLLFYDEYSHLNSSKLNEDLETKKTEVELYLEHVDVAINTEVYAAVEFRGTVHVFLVHQIRKNLSLKWEQDAIWHNESSFDRPPPVITLAMRRNNMARLPVTASALITHDKTLADSEDYLDKGVDSTTKAYYYMTKHLFDFVNATGFINSTSSYGYPLPDGTFDGIVRELDEGRSEFSATVMYILRNRMRVVEFISGSFNGHLLFVFIKPSLATVTNIYALPFSRDVWLALVGLVLVSALATVFASFRQSALSGSPITQRFSEGFHDTLCMVFQQGTYGNPVSLSGRQVLLVATMAYMFLYTAYSANVVALLQSSSNEIKTVEALVNSPLQCGAGNTSFNRQVFKNEDRPSHRGIWLKKAVPQGESFFQTVEDGIKKVRQGMYALHIESPAAFIEIQKTFLEHEKCNIGIIKYVSFAYPQFAIAKRSAIKEQLRIGVIRVQESGLQSRSSRRVMTPAPRCAGSAVFTPVNQMYLMPVYKILTILYVFSVVLLVLEMYVKRCVKRIVQKRMLAATRRRHFSC